MKYSAFFVNSVLLFTVPTLALYPQVIPLQHNYVQQQTESNHVLSYDEVMHLLEKLESGELEKKCTYEDLERINHFIVLLAREGVLSDDSEENLSLEDDIEELLNLDDNQYKYAFFLGTPGEYMVVPAVFNQDWEVVLCKTWIEKKWKQTKKFVKKHKKAIIIGTAVVVAVTVVVVAVVTATTAAAAAGAAGAAATSGSDKSDKPERKEESDPIPSVPIDIPPAQEAPALKAAMNEQILSFKENIVKEQFFESPISATQSQGLSWEENGRVLGSLFAHESLKNLEQQVADHPSLYQEIQAIGSQYHFPIPKGNTGTLLDFGHPEIDRRFSTDYSSLYATSEKEADFNALSYQVRGESALAYGYYDQAVHDLGKAIELNPTSPLPYLERGVAHFGLGQYDRSLEDYHQFTSQTQETHPSSITDFSLGFAKGLPQGIYDSGSGLFLFLSEGIAHPIHTGGQMWEALTLLSKLAFSEQWSALSEILAPEVHQLVEEWDALSSDKRGELAGYAFGKYGSDILIPGALAKAVSKGLKGAQELTTVYKGLQTAEKTLLLESVAGLENGARIAEVVQLEKQVSGWLGEGTKVIHNTAGDPVFLSKDGIRKVRFDFSRPYPHENPHLHFEEFVNGEWKEISRIYPNDVPHK